MGVLILLGSKSDREVAEKAVAILREFGVRYKVFVASAHRSPERVRQLVGGSDAQVIVAIAGLTNALAGVVASETHRPVIGVPVSGKVNLDAILSVTQLPAGIAVAAVGLDRGDSAALLAVEMLALKDAALGKKLEAWRLGQRRKVEEDSKDVEGL